MCVKIMCVLALSVLVGETIWPHTHTRTHARTHAHTHARTPTDTQRLTQRSRLETAGNVRTE